MRLAVEFGGARVRLIGNAEQSPRNLGQLANFTAVEDFYDGAEFADVSKYLSSSSKFRGGFWHKTLERLFVLEAFWRVSGELDILHAELDQLLFRIDELQGNLRSFGAQGLFFPIHNKDSAVASVFYANSRSALRSLLQFPYSGVSFPNEMVLLRMWALANPDLFFRLPTLANELGKGGWLLELGGRQIDSRSLGGIVDAAQLGQWVGGIDPRNVPLARQPETRFSDKPDPELISFDELSGLKFALGSPDGILRWELAEKKASGVIFNLHLHSKVHQALLRGKPSFEQLIGFSNQGRTVVLPRARLSQLQHHFTRSIASFLRAAADFIYKRAKALPPGLRARLHESVDRFVGRAKMSADSNSNFVSDRPGSQPYVSGDSFRMLANVFWEGNEKTKYSSSLAAGDIVFCESDRLDGFVKHVLEKNDAPIVLLLGNSDRNFDTGSLAPLIRKKSISVFAQNLVGAVDGAGVLPIGLENAWRNNHGIPETFDNARSQLPEEKLYRVLWGFKISTNPTIRASAAVTLLSCPLAHQIGRLEPAAHKEELARYAFVASPPGNGLDTHRTWEAMYLGCVPIVLRSHMAETYEQLGLPVWVLDDFSQLRDFSESQLREKYSEIAKKFECPALWFDFWEEMIVGAAQALRI